MRSIKPLDSNSSQSLDFVFDIAKKSMGFVPRSLKTMARIPGLVSSFSSFFANVFAEDGLVAPLVGVKLSWKNMIWTAQNLKRKDRLPTSLKHMVAYISSYTSGCRYCQAHTGSQMYRSGISVEKLSAVWEFEKSDLFTDAEKSALRFAVAASAVPNATSEEHFNSLRKYYNENQIVELGAAVAVFGFLNRWNDTFGTPLESEAISFAQEHLSASGWEIGKHVE